MPWRRCSRCLGLMYYESGYEGAWICLFCGRRVYAGGVLEPQGALEAPEGTHNVTRPPAPAYVNPQRVLREERATAIRDAYAQGSTQRGLANKYGVNQRTIARILAAGRGE